MESDRCFYGKHAIARTNKVIHIRSLWTIRGFGGTSLSKSQLGRAKKRGLLPIHFYFGK
jgi:hypothetical protein